MRRSSTARQALHGASPWWASWSTGRRERRAWTRSRRVGPRSSRANAWALRRQRNRRDRARQTLTSSRAVAELVRAAITTSARRRTQTSRCGRRATQVLCDLHQRLLGSGYAGNMTRSTSPSDPSPPNRLVCVGRLKGRSRSTSSFEGNTSVRASRVAFRVT